MHPQADSIARFRIDPTTGTLTQLGWTTTGISVPRTMNLDPTGRWLYVLNQTGDTIQQFEVEHRHRRPVVGAHDHLASACEHRLHRAAHALHAASGASAELGGRPKRAVGQRSPSVPVISCTITDDSKLTPLRCR